MPHQCCVSTGVCIGHVANGAPALKLSITDNYNGIQTIILERPLDLEPSSIPLF